MLRCISRNLVHNKHGDCALFILFNRVKIMTTNLGIQGYIPEKSSIKRPQERHSKTHLYFMFDF